LHVIPIQFSEIGNSNSLTFGGSHNRNATGKSGLGEYGKITAMAEWLLPSKFTIDEDPERRDALKSMVESLIPGYKIKSNYDDSSVEAIMKKAEGKNKWEKYNIYDDIDGLPKGIISAETKEEFESKIIKYVEHVKSQINRNVVNVKDAINSTLNSDVIGSLKYSNEEKQIFLNNLLKDYLNHDWEVLDIPEARAMGVIPMRNKKNSTINLLSITIHPLNSNSGIDGLTFGQVDVIKSMIFLNQYKSELLQGGFKVGEIITFNLEGKNYHREINSNAFKLFEDRLIKNKLNHTRKLDKSDFHSMDTIIMNLLKSSLNNYTGENKNEVESLFNTSEGFKWASADYKHLKTIQDAFLITYPELKNRTMNPTMNFSNKEEYLYAMLQMAINIKLGYLPEGDFYNLSNFGINFSDFTSLLAAIYTKEEPVFDKEGKKIMGLLQGLHFVTPDWVPSKDLRTINKIISLGNSKIAEGMCDQSAIISSFTREYYKEIGYSNMSQNWVGESQSKHQNLFIQKEGSVNPEFILKNPYKIDLQNRLEDSERKYLKQMLFNIQKYMLHLDSNVIKKFENGTLKVDKLEDLMSIPAIAEAINSGTYFKAPLVRREELSRHKGLIEGGLGRFWSRLKGRLGEIKDVLDPRELSEEELVNTKTSQLGYYEMYDIYGKQTDELKHNLISKNGISYYEFNLDTIAHRVAFNAIRKKEFDFRLPAINSYVWWMKLHAGKANVDISKELEYTANQINIGAFGNTIISEEAKTVVAAASFAKRITTAGMLAFRPSLLAKEMTIGTFKGISLAATQMFGKDIFTTEDMLEAYKKLITIDKKASIEWNLIDAMNNLYRFANMDANVISSKMQTDRRGVMKGLGRYMYACNTIPDYYNRMAIFLAVSIHDGSYDAHSITKDGNLVYDPKKDKRFSYYFKERDKNIDSKGRFIPKKNDEKYNTQRNLYLKLVEALNKENLVDPEYTEIFEKDIVKKAYSEIERTSIKTMSDMSYGYYDKDHSSQANQMWYGIIFGQFMQFWPGKMKMWFGKPTHDKDGKEIIASPIGKFKQKTKKDENGNEVKLWRKPIYADPYDSEKITDFEETTENNGDPFLEWTGSPQEGLIYAMLHTVQDVLRGDIKGAWADEARNRRVMFGLADTVFMMIILGIFKAIFDATIAETGGEGISGNTAVFAANVNKKVLSEANVWKNTLGAIKTEPVFWSYGTKVAGDIQNVLTGDKTVQQSISKSIRAFEFWQE
jgi:hypothetical protein